VIHCAAASSVPDSFQQREFYLENNVFGTQQLLKAMSFLRIRPLLFSSSSSVYGNAIDTPIEEQSPRQPNSPYGESKKLCESLIQEAENNRQIKAKCLRYFNVAGAGLDGQLGESFTKDFHVIPIFLRRALNGNDIKINGNNYPTNDGTCVRDFIHVTDVASANVTAIESLLAPNPKTGVFNLGSGIGISLLDIAKQVIDLTGSRSKILFSPRRRGDPPILQSNSQKFASSHDWQPCFSDIRTILETALIWEKSNPVMQFFSNSGLHRT
jgi:UDP-glucose-4-epimerase GalE